MQMTIGGIVNRFKLLIASIGEEGIQKLESNMNKLISNVLKKEMTHKPIIISILSECISKLPDISNIYAIFVAILGNSSFNFAFEIVKAIIKDLEKALNDGNIHFVRNYLKFFCDLLNCKIFEQKGLVDLFSQIANFSINYQYFDLLYNILYAMTRIDGSLLSNAEDITQYIASINEKLQVFSNEPEYNKLKIIITNLPNQMKEAKTQKNWNEFSDVHKQFKELQNSPQKTIQLLPKLELGSQFVKSKNSQLFNSSFNNNTIPIVNTLNKIKLNLLGIFDYQLILLEEYITDIFFSYDFSMELLLRNITQINSPKAHIIVLLKIFNDLFFRMNGPCKAHYLLRFLMKKHPNLNLAKEYSNIADFINKQFQENSNDLNFIHLIDLANLNALIIQDENYDFETLITNNEERLSISNVLKTKYHFLIFFILQKLLELVQKDKLTDFLPKVLFNYINNKEYHFKFLNSEVPYYSDAQIILDRIKEKVSAERMIELLTSSHQFESKDENQFEVFILCLIHTSAPSMQHAHKRFEQYSDVLKSFKGIPNIHYKIFSLIVQTLESNKILMYTCLNELMDNNVLSWNQMSACIGIEFKSYLKSKNEESLMKIFYLLKILDENSKKSEFSFLEFLKEIMNVENIDNDHQIENNYIIEECRNMFLKISNNQNSIDKKWENLYPSIISIVKKLLKVD